METAEFVAFYRSAIGELFQYFHRATAGDRRVSEDLVQETFIAIVTSYRQGHPDALTMPWLMGVARHKLLDHFRRVTREQRKLTLAYRSGDGDTDEFDGIGAAAALELLAGLSPTHRIVLLLRYVDDLAVSEVARMIGSSISATESLLVRARHALEQRLQEVRHA
ncbi:MAG: rpoE [Ilumatobacteraceae bacterium]|nr:rpoE [Ilumatobacteraceae bacterium]